MACGCISDGRTETCTENIGFVADDDMVVAKDALLQFGKSRRSRPRRLGALVREIVIENIIDVMGQLYFLAPIHDKPTMNSRLDETNIDPLRTVPEPTVLPTVGRVQETSYHAAPSKDSTSLELDDAREYGDFDAGDDDGRRRDVDAGAIHADSDRDAGVGDDDGDDEKGFGGENTEYDDMMAPEDDDERFGEALPEELGGRGEGAVVGYESTGGSGEPVDVSESQEIFPGSDRW
ncbi:hypothetical protein BXZ70DRAFT_908022 [Cristinia sonorae]|uniref:Uncharacterized protein n=1 Tax=Cristinia sonorae TaxID=1940300 RepID=A0A8K0UNZ3_9AGAR|nr:hypothetical protein BXZ70DRAFT_908022 [Cristinia sonorae]